MNEDKKGFKIICLRCGNEEGNKVEIYFRDHDDYPMISCPKCKNEQLITK